MKLHLPHSPIRTDTRGGYVIFAVLIVVVVLSLVAYRFTDSMTGEYRASVRINDDAQLKMAAVSGLHYAAAALSDRATFNDELGGNPYDNEDIFAEFELPITTTTGLPPTRRPYFSIRAVALNDTGAYEQRFGVIDEGGKLNINSLIALDPTGQLLYNALMKLPNMTPELADAIVDWVDADDDARSNGAESSYYASLPSPYKAKNGPLNSLDELLLVKGVTPYLLYGGDTNRNGVVDEGEQDSTRGWSDYLTVYGRELNIDSTGTARIYLNGDNLDTLYKQLQGAVGNDLAVYIIASKVFTPAQVVSSTTITTITSSSGSTSDKTTLALSLVAQAKQNTVTATTDQLWTAVQAKIASSGSSGTRVRSLIDLAGTQITLPRDPNAKKDDPTVVAYSPLNDPTQIKDLLPKLFDKTTVRQPIEMVPRLNVNTAPREVLQGITDQNGNSIFSDTEIDSIISQRASQPPTDPATTTCAWLLTNAVINPTKYKTLEKYITGSTMVYRVQSIGYFKGVNGPVARMEAIIDTNQGAPRFLMVRDLSDLDNPRGFQPPTTQN